jgi:hypothetical protein
VYPNGLPIGIHSIDSWDLYVGKIQIMWIEKANEMVMISKHDKEQQTQHP